MLTVSNITRQFRGADAPILKDITFTVNAGERVGLIGPNGSGKSTLLSIIVGQTKADSGGVQFNPPDLRVGYLAQGVTVPDETPVRDVLFPQATALEIAQADVERLAAQLADGSPDESNGLIYSEALERLATLGYDIDMAEGERMLARVGLGDVSLDWPVGALSGGQKTRLNLAALLLNQPQLLVLDEPTNHLDVTALDWLESWLNDFPGGVLIVSHDRAFLDGVVNRIVALDAEAHTARVFTGNYSDYLETLHHERSKQWSEWKDQEVEIARLTTDARDTMAKAVRKENATRDSTQRRYAKKVAQRAKAKEKRVERYLDSDERVEKPKLGWNVKMEFDEIAPIGGDAVRLEDTAVGYDPALPLLENLNLTVQGGERIAIMGPNGHGKSTLIKTIIGQLAPLAGSIRIGTSVKVGYLAQEQDILDPQANALTTIQREAKMNDTEARSFLHFFLFAGDDLLRPIAQLSYGERARLMLARLVAGGANLLVLDEPLNHLDLPSREKFEEALLNYPGAVLAVAHDRYFIERFADKVWHVADGQLDVEFVTAEVA